MSKLLPFAIAWVVLGCVVLVLALRRRAITEAEDDSVHLNEGEVVVSGQVEIAKRLASLDKWGKLLTIVLAITGVILAICYGVVLWEATSKVGLA
jgi:cytochrome b subunit of formate dehydrogenase